MGSRRGRGLDLWSLRHALSKRFPVYSARRILGTGNIRCVIRGRGLDLCSPLRRRSKRFPAGDYHVPCALIIRQRKESTDKKTSLNAALRDFDVAV